MMTTLIILGLVVALIGLVGCILPLIPGPPLSFFSLLILSFAKGWEPFSPTFLILMAGLTIAVTICDYAVPISAAKRYGASKPGVWLSIAGLLIGLFLLPPWGMVIGAVGGAFIGELLAGKRGRQALRASWGVVVGNLFVIGIKIGLCGIILFLYVKEVV
jgi:uncharacterized protein YqgC (DUF456 family)